MLQLGLSSVSLPSHLTSDPCTVRTYLALQFKLRRNCLRFARLFDEVYPLAMGNPSLMGCPRERDETKNDEILARRDDDQGPKE